MSTEIKQNLAQEEVIHHIDGPMIVIACPGAGKTTTLLRRIQNMIASGIKEDNILMVTFTRTAAHDMKKRYLAMKGDESKTTGVTFKTLHSLCLNILVNIGMYKREDVLDESKGYDFVYEVLTKKYTIPEAWDVAKNVLNEISWIKNNYIEVFEFEPKSCSKKIFLDIFSMYQDYMTENHLVDYDDMMLEVESLMRKWPKFKKQMQNKYRYILCDEYQDTNPVQKNILYLMAGTQKNICVVGDDDQSIYGFRGANPRIMFEFEQDMSPCRVINMSTNYRSGQVIVDHANMLIKKNKVRFDKNFVSFRGENGFRGEYAYKQFGDRFDEMQYVADQIQELHGQGIPYNDMAILFRTNKQAQIPMETLKKNGIPFESSEKVKSMYERWIFKLLCSYINLSCGKWSQKMMDDIIARPNKFLNKEEFIGCPFDAHEMKQRLSYITIPWKLNQSIKSIDAIFTAFGPGNISAETQPIKVMQAFDYIGIKEEIKTQAVKTNMETDEALAELTALTEDAKKFSTIKEWMRYANEEIRNTRKLNRTVPVNGGVQIMTMHKSKGCEWHTVFVIDVNDKIVPNTNGKLSPELEEEERRLLYVAMTRARDRLEVLCSGLESRFMKELGYGSRTSELDKIKKLKTLVGLKVIHKTYGEGFIIYDKDGKLKVSFIDQIRMFKYPDAITDGHLKFDI